MVLKKVTWPHELMCMATGQPAMYEDMSVNIFVSGYLEFMEMVKPSIKPFMAKHLKEFMVDAEVYGNAPVRAYHTVCYNKLKMAEHSGQMLMQN